MMLFTVCNYLQDISKCCYLYMKNILKLKYTYLIEIFYLDLILIIEIEHLETSKLVHKSYPVLYSQTTVIRATIQTQDSTISPNSDMIIINLKYYQKVKSCCNSYHYLKSVISVVNKKEICLQQSQVENLRCCKHAFQFNPDIGTASGI
ncbi:Protein of unknown function [Gryllus bimaculatus]|nr:Protein of unknown function [Gryllus bimaculatus]